MTESAVSGALVHKDEGIQKSVYYISRSLTEAQIRYQRMKKLVLALFVPLRKLRHYFQSFPITVLTKHPLRNIIENPEATRMIAKWAAELNPHDVKYEPKTTIKGQVLADFIAEFTPRTSAQGDMLEGWIINVDGASNSKGASIRLVLTLPRAPLSSNHSYSIFLLEQQGRARSHNY